jgi:hypothetical protein
MVTVSLGMQRSVQKWGAVEIVSLYKGIPKLEITEGHIWMSTNAAFVVDTQAGEAYALGLQTVRIIFTNPAQQTGSSAVEGQSMNGLGGLWERFLRSI